MLCLKVTSVNTHKVSCEKRHKNPKLECDTSKLTLATFNKYLYVTNVEFFHLDLFILSYISLKRICDNLMDAIL